MLDGIGTAPPRNDFAGTVGYEFKTGPNDILVTELGFVDPEGDGLYGTHQVAIWVPSYAVPLAQVTVDPASATNIGLYWYTPLERPVVLAANSVFWIAGEVLLGGDYWMNAGDTLAANPGFTQPTFAGFTFDAHPAEAAGIYRAGGFGIPNARQGGIVDTIFTSSNLRGEIPSSPIKPQLVTQPQGGLRLAGDTITFEVLGFGSSPLVYQWRKGEVELTGATNSFLTLTNVQVGDAGDYAVVLSNPAGTVTSAVATLSVTNPPVDITSGLVMHLTLDDGEGLVAKDATSNHHDGTLQGFPGETAQWVPGRMSGAVEFNPTEAPNEVILVPDNGGLDFSQSLNFSLAVWVNGGPAQVEGAGILAKGTGGGGEQYALDVYQGKFRFYGWVGDGSYYLVTAPLGPNNTWQHLAMLFSTSLNRLKFYLNGTEVAGSTLPKAIIPTAHDISIGSRQLGDADYNLSFNGKIDDVRLYGRVLTSQDVAALYNLAAVVPPTIVRQPTGGGFYRCETAVLSVLVDGSEPLSYQWKKDGQDLPGATQSSLVLQDLTSAQAGGYQVAATNSRGGVLSDVAQVTVRSGNTGRFYVDLNAAGNRNDFTGTVGGRWGIGANPLTVTALGYEDQGRDGLNLDHQVGIWDSTGAMVASVTVPAGTGGTLDGAWRYVSLTPPVVLAAGASYWMGAQVFGSDGDGWSDSGGSTAAPFGTTCCAAIEMPTYAVGDFAAPLNDGGGGSALRWGPANAQFTVEVPPTLAIVLGDGKVTISWGTDYTGWVLEGSAGLPATSWVAVQGVSNNRVTITPSETQQFYRLRHP